VDLFNPSMMDHMIDLYDLLFKKSSKFLSTSCKSYHDMTEMIYVTNFVRLLELFMKQAGLADSRVTEMELKTFQNKINVCFVMGLSLTLGVLVKDEFRKPFDKFLRRAVSEPVKSELNQERILNFERNVSPPEIQGALMIDYYLDFEDWKWHSYKDQTTKLTEEEKKTTYASFYDITVETEESLRIRRSIRLSRLYNLNYLIIGPTGIGKTQII